MEINRELSKRQFMQKENDYHHSPYETELEFYSAVGGIPSLTVAVVIVVGLFGAICGFKLLQVGRVASPIAQGLSMGRNLYTFALSFIRFVC